MSCIILGKPDNDGLICFRTLGKERRSDSSRRNLEFVVSSPVDNSVSSVLNCTDALSVRRRALISGGKAKLAIVVETSALPLQER